MTESGSPEQPENPEAPIQPSSKKRKLGRAAVALGTAAVIAGGVGLRMQSQDSDSAPVNSSTPGATAAAPETTTTLPPSPTTTTTEAPPPPPPPATARPQEAPRVAEAAIPIENQPIHYSVEKAGAEWFKGFDVRLTQWQKSAEGNIPLGAGEIGFADEKKGPVDLYTQILQVVANQKDKTVNEIEKELAQTGGVLTGFTMLAQSKDESEIEKRVMDLHLGQGVLLKDTHPDEIAKSQAPHFSARSDSDPTFELTFAVVDGLLTVWAPSHENTTPNKPQLVGDALFKGLNKLDITTTATEPSPKPVDPAVFPQMFGIRR